MLQIPGFHFHEFLINALLASSHSESAKHIPVKAKLHPEKIPSICC